MSEPVCKVCGSDRLSPTQQRRPPTGRRCARCINRSAAGLAARRRYMRRRNRTPEGQRDWARRIRVNETYFGVATTPEQAAQIKAHIRARVHSFKEQQRAAFERQQNREEAESPATG